MKLCSLSTEIFQETIDIVDGQYEDYLTDIQTFSKNNNFFTGPKFTYFVKRHQSFVKKAMNRLEKEMFFFIYGVFVLLVLMAISCIYMKLIWLMPFWYPIDTNTTFG